MPVLAAYEQALSIVQKYGGRFCNYLDSFTNSPHVSRHLPGINHRGRENDVQCDTLGRESDSIEEHSAAEWRKDTRYLWIDRKRWDLTGPSSEIWDCTSMPVMKGVKMHIFQFE
jgi:hypothetical protein